MSQPIIDVIHRLAAEGKAVTTATVRARLSGPVNMAELISLVNRYRSAPESLPTAAPAETSSEQSPEQRLLALEEKVRMLEARLARLEESGV
ncbi:hypothetical protein [Oceanimonas baumannii]|uniref:KfrA N-terminal DNA-binding domain-containing protein n=1 Tax=Oceanimonas baumannii TaxID=129578 RepID=A0A235CN19_9GAMM|nr:hypothetical protein [Oceanimonas baumannii]OYD25962.1 hypothetical protein B6S09_03745 [Oceanimonas baumannii]TDW60017.1 hypothetical protein LY04_01009 [Oceanimonas baumannii]